MKGFMFDTNIFNDILNNNIQINWPNEFNYYVTHIQFDELNETRNTDRKNELLKTFKEIDTEEILTESGKVGISKVDKCKVGDNKLYYLLLAKLQKLDGKKKKWKNQPRDILIAETCIKNKLILITNDGNLGEVMTEFNGHTKNLGELLISLSI